MAIIRRAHFLVGHDFGREIFFHFLFRRILADCVVVKVETDYEFVVLD
jgi:hypothetical protein